MRTDLRRLSAFCLAASVSACLQFSTGPGSGKEGAPAGSSAVSVEGGAPAQPTGAGCGVETSTNTTMCTAISLCPQIVVDHDLYPTCGFRLHGNALDVECACSGSLCPLGSPATCAQVAQLLANQNQVSVCAQINEGRCTRGASGFDAGRTNPCDKICASECGGNPQCLSDCGC